MIGFCITLIKNFAFFKSGVLLYAKAFWVLSKDRFILTLVRIANIGWKMGMTKK
jgi:hypothetical protein